MRASVYVARKYHDECLAVVIDEEFQIPLFPTVLNAIHVRDYIWQRIKQKRLSEVLGTSGSKNFLNRSIRIVVPVVANEPIDTAARSVQPVTN